MTEELKKNTELWEEVFHEFANLALSNRNITFGQFLIKYYNPPLKLKK